MPQQNSAKMALEATAAYKLKLVSIEVDNFKSFSGSANADQGSHTIGPFTQFTGIIGPNGVGKSNIFDAVAFALNLSLAPGKIRHARDLAHRLKKVNGEQPHEQAAVHHTEFFVKLNFIKSDLDGSNKEKLSIQRGLKRCPDDNSAEGKFFNEYVINEDHERPLLYEEYKQLLTTIYNLDIQEFALYQN